MAGKPELSAVPGVQNVVVYVSNDNFAQAYTVNHQNVAQHVHNNGGFTNSSHSMAPLATSKGFAAKHTVVDTNNTYNSQAGYYTNQAVISQNGYSQPVANNLNYKPPDSKIPYIHNELLTERKTEVHKECSDYITELNYAVMGGEGSSVRCDSVRSETAESSCSSLSSADESMLVVQPEMVVYDNNSVNVRHGVVTVAGAHPSAGASLVGSLSNNHTVSVPNGWKRLLTNGEIIYISPSSTALSSLDQLKEYLLTPGTCKCGLECPLKFDSVFNFDPKVVSRRWTLSPDTNTGDLTKLCNHKRKILAMASISCKPPDPEKIPKDYIKKKKRKLCGSYAGVSVSQILAQRQKMQQPFNKENTTNLRFPQQQILQEHSLQGHVAMPEIQQNSTPFFKYHNADNRLGSPVVFSDIVVQSASNQNISHQMQLQQSISTSLQSPQIQLQPQQQSHIVAPNSHLLNNQLGITNINNEVVNIVNQSQQRLFINGQPNEPSGPGRPHIIPVSTRPETNQRIHQSQFYNQYNYDSNKNIRPFGPCNGYRQHAPVNPVLMNQQKIWNHRVSLPSQSPQNGYDRVPPLYQHQPPPTVWQDEINRKKIKNSKCAKKRPFIMENSHRTLEGHTPCPNIDVRQITENRVMIGQYQNEQNSSPSFLEDPSGYLAQQTALLNNTINRQTGCSNLISNSPVTSMPNQILNTSQTNGVPLPSNIQIKQPQAYNVPQKSQHSIIKNQIGLPHYMANQGLADSSAVTQTNCQGCVVDYQQALDHKDIRVFPRPSSQPGTPNSCGTIEDSVTSSNCLDKHHSPDSRPIQGGTVSTSNVSPIEGSPDPTSHTPTPPQQDSLQFQTSCSYQELNQNQQHATNFQFNQNMQQNNYQKQEIYCQQQRAIPQGIVTTMASGRTVGSNTITSVLAGRANTATVSMTNPVNQTPNSSQASVPISKSPLEMVQSVVSSIKVPQSQQQHNILSVQNIPQQMVKSLPPGHIFVSSGGQLIMASSNSGQVMPPPPPKIVTNQTSMPPISVSPMITNVTGSVTQMIPAVAQQVLGQQTVLVNALPTPFVLQPGVTMTMDGMNMQIPHLVTGNVIQQQIQIDNSDPRRVTNILSPENKKKGKKRKVSPQTVASMLHIAAQQNSGVVGFPQQLQMAHSPQGITTPVMQALTIVPGKAGAPPQIVMNSQLSNTQQLMNSQSTQQINLLQPVNLTQGVVQNFPTIQQFVLPNLTGMVMNADGTATIVQEPNIGMQLQLQNVNGQNVLTTVQNNQMFTGGQNIIPTGMVIRPQGKIIQQQHSPGTQFLSPNSAGQFVAQFNGQLSPLVANVSPGQQVTFSPQQIRPTNQQQEYIQCGQTLMVPTNIAASTSNQNTTYVQQNTTIVQQQTTMLSNNQTEQNQSLNVDQNFIISDKQPVQTVVLQQRQHSPMQQIPPNYRHSVSTQTAVNQNRQSVTTNTFCQTSTNTSSPPDTTTHSPLASGGQSPPTADTTTHSGSTDDGFSPAPSSGSCSDIVNLQQQHSSMAMVHCISSSEPDSVETNLLIPEFDWKHMSSSSRPKIEFTDIANATAHMHPKKTSTHVAYAESSTMMNLVTDINKQPPQQESVVSSRYSYEKMHKRKHGDSLAIMEANHMHSSLFEAESDERDHGVIQSPNTFLIGDLVWGPARGCLAWPGKLIEVKKDKVVVRWFGDKTISELGMSVLQTLSEGLDAHHRASKKLRTSRKLNTQLEKAIQEAMSELDKVEVQDEIKVKADIAVNIVKKSGGRLRSSQR